jgi:hypothetical protein
MHDPQNWNMEHLEAHNTELNHPFHGKTATRLFLSGRSGWITPTTTTKMEGKDGEESDLGLQAPKEKDKQVLEENLLQFGDSLWFNICS